MIIDNEILKIAFDNLNLDYVEYIGEYELIHNLNLIFVSYKTKSDLEQNIMGYNINTIAIIYIKDYMTISRKHKLNSINKCISKNK